MDNYGYIYGYAMDLLARLEITPALMRDIARVDEFKGRWASLSQLAPERLSSLRRIATIESIGSSTRIEGVKLTDEEISKLLSGLDITSLKTRDEQEVAGYAELMELIFESWREIPLTENHLKQLHGVLLKHSDKDQRHRGAYKTSPNNVEAVDEHGQRIGIVFETASPFDTPRLMAELVGWARPALETDEHHPLLILGVFIVRFLAIHPFQDGNGRLSRALTTLLMLRSGYEFAPFSSLERIIEANKVEYYRTLRSAQGTLDKDESKLIDWLSFFARCLVQQTDALAVRVERERIAAPLSPLSDQLLVLVRERGKITVREATELTEANRNTVKKHLRKLVEAGKLVQRGSGKGTWYELP